MKDIVTGRTVIDVARATDPLVASPPALISTIRERIAEEQDKERAAKKAIHTMETEEFSSILAQPEPIPQSGPAIWDLVIADIDPSDIELIEGMRARAELGRRRYGTPLQAFNGRDPLIDAFQEALDLVVYLKQAVMEGRVGDGLYKRALRMLYAVRGDREFSPPSILAAPLPDGEQPTLGRVAYDAYGKARNWIAFNNQPIPQWEERPNLHEAWETVAKAISAESLETIARLTRERDSAIKQWKRAEQGIEEAHAALPAYLGAGALPVRIKELVDDENKAQADLEMLKAEVKRMEPLFDASVAWCKTVGGSDEEATALHFVMKAFNETLAKDAQ